MTAKKPTATPKQQKPAPQTLPAGQGAQPGDIINALATQRNQLMDALAMSEANFAAFKRNHQAGGCGVEAAQAPHDHADA